MSFFTSLACAVAIFDCPILVDESQLDWSAETGQRVHEMDVLFAEDKTDSVKEKYNSYRSIYVLNTSDLGAYAYENGLEILGEGYACKYENGDIVEAFSEDLSLQALSLMTVNAMRVVNENGDLRNHLTSSYCEKSAEAIELAEERRAGLIEAHFDSVGTQQQ